VLVALALGALYLAFWPVSIDPVAWTPPPSPPLTGVLAIDDQLEHGTRFATSLEGPEAVAFDAEGRLVTGLLDGRIVRIVGNEITTLAETGGRPLGIAFDAAGRMVVADAYRGLLRVDAQGRVETLATTHGGKPFRFTDDLAIGSDGTIYFSDASWKFPLSEYKLDLLEHRPNGRLLAFHPDTNRVEELARDLYFANGVEVTPDGTGVIVCETWAYRLVRISLAAGTRGKKTTFTNGIPGFCDNVRYSRDRGVYWVAVGSPRLPTVDGTAGSPAMRRLFARLPAYFLPKPASHAMVVAVNLEGIIVDAMHYEGAGAYAPIASVVERRGELFIGSFREHGLLRVRIP
jgi:sugar lactone lactonase YvrE